VQKWLLPTLSEILAETTEQSAHNTVFSSDGIARINAEQSSTSQLALQHLKAEREWFGAIAALEQLLRSNWVNNDNANNDDTESSFTQGLILAGPLPVFSDPTFADYFPTWVFCTQLAKPWAWMPFQLPPAKENQTSSSDRSNSLPLLPGDPLGMEQFCLVFTTNFSLVMVLGEDSQGNVTFQFSFEPDVVLQAWDSLRLRMLLACPHQIKQLDSLVQRFAPVAPDYRTVMQFSRLMLKYLPQPEEQEQHENLKFKKPDAKSHDSSVINQQNSLNSKTKIQNLNSNEVELLQAFAHEVKTPLATIRTFTRLLLRRKELGSDILKKLEVIDHECTEQIDRMELLFQAAEMETADAGETPVYLTTTSLSQVFQESIPRWQKQAERRSQTLDVLLPQQMPLVMSDPTMLDRILTSLIDNFTRSLPAGSHIQVQVMPAGNQLKLQLLTQTSDDKRDGKCFANHHSTRKLIGQLLTFQPETGSLSLSHNVTKSLFQALGGKLIVRERPEQGEVFTIFLPTGEGQAK
jgi:signal transduction histidine kinase